MPQVKGVEVCTGVRFLLSPVSLQVTAGDRIGLVGRNGAGKTTLTRILAEKGLSAAGTITRSGRFGCLPQDPRSEGPEQLARSQILGVRGLDQVIARLGKAEREISSSRGAEREKVMTAYARAENMLLSAGGYAAEAGAARITANLGLPDRVLGQPFCTLSGGQRRRIELARILFFDADTLLLGGPTSHLDADPITWSRGYLQSFGGGLVVISHGVGLLETVVNKMSHLDVNRVELDLYAMDWKYYLRQRETNEKCHEQERLNMERRASQLMAQADRMHTKIIKAVTAQSAARCAEKLLSSIKGERKHDKVAWIRFPGPASCERTPLLACDLSKAYDSLEVFTTVGLVIDKGSKVVILGLSGAGKTTMLHLLAESKEPDVGQRILDHGARPGYYAQEHEALDISRPVLENMVSTSPDPGDVEVRKVLSSFLFTGDDVDKPAKVFSGGGKTRLTLATLVVSAANVLLLNKPTNNLDPASHAEVLSALHSYPGAVVLITHDLGAVEALEPDRMLVLPDGVEDPWSDDYADLIALA